MNKLTLTFSDPKLEHKYQQTQAALTKQGLGYKLSIPIISYLFQGTYWVIKNYTLLAVAYFVLSLLYSYILYKITIRGEWVNYICYVMVSFTLSASAIQFIPQLMHLTMNETLWIEDTAILMGTQINISSHPLLNAGMLALFLATKIYLRPFSYLCVVFVLLALQTWFHQYERIQNLRLQFLQKEKSVNQYNVFDDLIKDSLIILNYNQEWDRFTVAFTNQQFLKEYSHFAIDFLRELQFSQHKMSAMTYLHYKVNETKNQFNFEAFWKDHNQHIMIECWKYSILETQIILKFITKKSYSENMYPLLYKGILRKLKKIDRQHYHTESLKNILAALLVRPSSLVNVKIQPLNYRQLSALMMNLLRDNAAIFSLNLKSETFFTNVPLLYILMISLTKYYNVSSFSMHQLDENQLEVLLKGKVKQINESNKPFFHKLLNILVELLGIQQFQLENFAFTCKIVNMESPFKSTMN